MALFDRDAGRLVVRIVYDGPPQAGKTTNLRELTRYFSVERRSELYTPAEDNGRTLYFDWLQLECGFVAGHPLRCQLVSVPGQQEYALRRSHLLREADAVVFVCESSRAGLAAARHGFDLLRRYLARHGRGDAPVVVQANKQDLPGALPAAEVAAELGGAARHVAARAAEGAGVRETVVLAVRAVSERLQSLLRAHGTDALAGAPSNAEDLYRELRAAEARGDGGQQRARPEVTTSASSIAAAARAAAPQARDALLPGADVPIGCVWPAVAGRAALAALARERAERRDDLVVSLAGARELADRPVIYDIGPARARTAPRLRYATLDAGRAALRRLAQRRQQLGELVDSAAVLALHAAPDGAWWIWDIAPRRTTLQALLVRANGRRNEEALAGALARYADVAVRAALLAQWHGLELDLHPSGYAARAAGVAGDERALADDAGASGDVVYLDEVVDAGPRDTDLAVALVQRVEEYPQWPGAVARYLDAVAVALRAAHGRGADLAPWIESLARAPAHTPAARAAHARLHETFVAARASLAAEGAR